MGYRLSDLCLVNGIILDWFPEEWSFGNVITNHKTTATLEHDLVVYGTGLN